MHEEYEMSQAWPSYRPHLSSFQLQVGVRIHAIYEHLRQQDQAESIRGMFRG